MSLAIDVCNSADLLMQAAEESLQFLKAVLDRSAIPQQCSVAVHRAVERIYQRRSDPILQVAVVGEFSSGKSTFINALLRDELLAASPLVTTARETRLRHGLSLGACLKEGNEDEGTLRTIRPQEEFSDSQIRAFVNAAVVGQSGADTDRWVEISHPATFLQAGVAVIDTPGLNADRPEHERVTLRTVEHLADAAIILVPGVQIVPRTLVRFLRGPFRPLLRRSAFVMTKMDLLPEREHLPVKRRLREVIQKEFDLDPLILDCAAQAVVDRIAGRQFSENENKWADQFENMQEELLAFLSAERPLAIAENVVRIIGHISKILEAPLIEKADEYKKRREAILAVTIRNLDAFTEERRKEIDRASRQVMQETALRFSNHAAAAGSGLQESIRNTIETAADGTELRDALYDDGGIQKLIDNYQSNLQCELRTALERIANAAAAITANLNRQFAEAYRRLAAFGVRQRNGIATQTSFSLAQGSSLLADAANAQGLHDKVDTAAGWAVFIGAGALAVAIGGPVAFVGALMGGGALFSWIEQKHLEHRKATVLAQVLPAIDKVCAAATERGGEHIRNAGNRAQHEVLQYLSATVGHYRQAIDELLANNMAEARKFQAREAALRRDIEELDKRVVHLNEEQEFLARSQSHG